MEGKLRNMFEYQKFSHNSRIDSMANMAEERFNKALSEEELFLVSAAGTIPPMPTISDTEETK